MKAIVYRKYGPPEVLEIVECQTPSPKNNELLIKVHAAEATKADCEMRGFNFSVKWFWLPLRLATGIFKPRNPILGGYFSGEIEAVGKDVKQHKVGDRVFACASIGFGAYAEYICLPSTRTIVKMPHNLNYEQAAAVPLGGLNALHFLRKANVTKGDTILINGAGGSIGSFAIQIAKSMGAIVTAVDSGHKALTLKTIGADYFVNYEQEDFREQGKKYDIIFDMVPSSSYSNCVKLLNPKGRYVMGNPSLGKMLRSPLTRRFSDKQALFAFAGEKKEELQTLKNMIEANEICPTIDKVYPMGEAVRAHYRVETEQRIGCVVIAMNDSKSTPPL